MRSRDGSSCATARSRTTADGTTKGRISSPAPNLSPTSFIAGSSTSLSVGTAPIFSTDLSIQSSTPASLRRRRWHAERLRRRLLAAQDVEVPRLLGLHALGRVGLLLLGLRAARLEMLDELLQRVV